jgi:uncharacterized repeat protein (TIGR03806 family)
MRFLPLLLLVGCGGSGEKIPYQNLSEYHLLTPSGGAVSYADGVVPYDLNTPLFSDYALKSRAVKLPMGMAAAYDPDNVFQFPVGTIVMKTFSFAPDERDPTTSARLYETRLLIRQKDMSWLGLPYVWNDAQTEAVLTPAGGMPTIDFISPGGDSEEAHYLIPTEGQCKECHDATGTFDVLGPRARELNRDFDYGGGTVENQLTHWANAGILTGAPDPSAAPVLPVFDDPSTGSVTDRARAWLEGNCAHCHNPTGLARTTGLFLKVSETEPSQYGICKTPVAAGPGTGGFTYDIVPGDPDHSILVFRIESTMPGIMMPQIGRSVVHKEGVQLIRDWISSLVGGCP